MTDGAAEERDSRRSAALHPRAARWFDVAFGVILVAFALGVLYGAFGPWQWGHNGFNGAAFAQAARNTIRFGTPGEAREWTGLVPPPPAEIYTHHPQLLHWHLVTVFRLFGEVPWIGRMIPAFYSIATLVLVYWIGIRLWDRRTALLASFIYAMTPLHTIFANMIDHEQGGIFWLLLSVYQYVRWGEDHSRRRLILLLVTISIAAQFDFPAYYVAFFLAVHAFVEGLRGGRPLLRARPQWTFLVVFSAVVLANFGGFFLWIWSVRGTLSEMGHAYNHRAGVKLATGYAVTQYVRIVDLYGPLIAWLTVAWLPLVGWRLRRGLGQRRDLIPACFFAGQLVHSIVFNGAGWIHSYWTYYLGVACAFGGAEVALTAYDWVAKKLAERAVWMRIALVAVASALIVGQIRTSWRTLRWGYATATGAYINPTPDQRTEIRFARWLAAHYSRQDTHYLVHASLPVRIEFHWYTDSPFDALKDLDPIIPPAAAGKRVVLLVDASRNGARAALGRLADRHPTVVFDRKLVAVEISAGVSSFVAVKSVPRRGSIFHKWFVDPLRPPMSIEPDDEAAARKVVAYSGSVDTEVTTATLSGNKFEWDCPDGQAVYAVEGAENVPPGAVAHVRAKCRALASAEPQDSTSPWAGGRTSAPDVMLACPPGAFVTGVEARTTNWVAGLSVICAPLVPGAGGGPPTLGPPQQLPGSIGAPRSAAAEGAPPLTVQPVSCSFGRIARGLRIRSGALVDGFGLACGKP